MFKVVIEDFIMCTEHITIMIISTMPDMFAEHYYFIKDVFPDLKDICSKHDIELDYVDLLYSMSKEEFDNCRSVHRYFNSIDSDRTFYICFRGQKLGCVPTYEDIDKDTLKEYPELVDYIGNISFTELTVMHAIHPFEKCEDGEIQKLSPVKHSLFYFRDDHYLDNLSKSQKAVYSCNPKCDDVFIQDLKLAMAKDLIVNDKQEFDKLKDSISNINIRKYKGMWYENADLLELIDDYTEEYAKLKNKSVDELKTYYDKSSLKDSHGCFVDFKCDDKSLKGIMIDDFLNELKLEFPENFNQ